ncbi:MAG: LapA family protein [Nostocaceae cyanobacterium]|nr:LapA family protein [Nostocaceae cyanobacterium]
MSITRLIIFGLILVGLMFLLVQNLSPVLPVFFLGMQTKALPLGLWILCSTAAGAVTSLLITSLFKLSNLFIEEPQPTRERSRFTSRRNQQIPSQETTTRRPSSPPPKSDRDFRDNPLEDDWDTYRGTDDDWGFEDTPESTTTAQKTQTQTRTQVQEPKNYEGQQEPKSSYKSGSSYSYSISEPENSGVGKSESIYDADYRVIIPPYRPPASPQVESNDDEDWGIFDDEDEDERK